MKRRRRRHERLVHALGHLLSLANIRHSVNDSNVEFLGQDSQGNLRPADILIPNFFFSSVMGSNKLL